MFEKFLDPYILSALAGGLCSIAVLFFLRKKRPVDSISLFWSGIFAIIGMFIGAHVLFFLVNLPSFSARYGGNIYDIQSFLVAVFNAASGMVFYGGLFGALISLSLFCRSRRLNTRSFLNPICCIMPLFHAFGRIGCSLGGCCYGLEYHGFLAIQYTKAHINPGISDHIADFPRFPVQPLEAALELCICAVLIILYIKKGNKYALVPIYLLLYGLVRFSDEFLRGDTVRGIWGPFSTSQWISLGCIVASVVYYVLAAKRKSCN